MLRFVFEAYLIYDVLTRLLKCHLFDLKKILNHGILFSQLKINLVKRLSLFDIIHAIFANNNLSI